MKPINPALFFGPNGGPSPKLQCTAILDIGVGVELCYITKQVTQNRYNLTSVSTPSRTLTRCVLVEGTPVNLGDMHITVTPFGGSAESARKIMTHRVDTFEDDGAYEWQIGVAASAPGQATVESA